MPGSTPSMGQVTRWLISQVVIRRGAQRRVSAGQSVGVACRNWSIVVNGSLWVLSRAVKIRRTRLPSIIRMPAQHELPAGPRRRFVEELHDHYRAARRPSLRVISDRIKERADDLNLAGTASRETIRRMLLDTTVPANWETVNAVFLILCEIANRNPEDNHYEVNGFEAPPTHTESLELAWNQALDDQPSDRPYDDTPPF
jgi:hypothetical protein